MTVSLENHEPRFCLKHPEVELQYRTEGTWAGSNEYCPQCLIEEEEARLAAEAEPEVEIDEDVIE